MWRKTVIAVLMCVLCMGAVGVSVAGELPVVTGKHWLEASKGEKLAFLLGMGTIIELEKEYQGASPAANSLNEKLVKGLCDDTFHGIKDYLDQYYLDHPDAVERPVVEVIWYDLIAPDLEAQK